MGDLVIVASSHQETAQATHLFLMQLDVSSPFSAIEVAQHELHHIHHPLPCIWQGKAWQPLQPSFPERRGPSTQMVVSHLFNGPQWVVS